MNEKAKKADSNCLSLASWAETREGECGPWMVGHDTRIWLVPDCGEDLGYSGRGNGVLGAC